MAHSDNSTQFSPPPRVVIVGAGIAGLSAASHLLSSLPHHRLLLTVLEASPYPGGRIRSATFAGHRVEVGATWIHGVDGSPIYALAQRSGAINNVDINGNDDIPWECMDGLPCTPPDLLLAVTNPTTPSIASLRRSIIPTSIAHPIALLYHNLFSAIQHTTGGLHHLPSASPFPVSPSLRHLKRRHILNGGGSVGAYLQEGLRLYLSDQKRRLTCRDDGGHACAAADSRGSKSCVAEFEERQLVDNWTTTERLQRDIFEMHENVERSVTGADSLHNLSLEANEEYWEYPGDHITVQKGYDAIIRAMVASIPDNTIQFSKRVRQIVWLNDVCDAETGATVHPSGRAAAPVHILCDDGTSYEADHVIITVSLGVLKAEALIRRTAIDMCRNRSFPAPTPSNNCLFDPPLPSWKQISIASLGFGVVDKCFIAMKPSTSGTIYPHAQLVFGGEHGVADDSVPRWMRRNFSFYPIHRRSNVLCMWLTGSDAVEAEGLTDEEVIDGIVRTMEAFGYGKLRFSEDGAKERGKDRKGVAGGVLCRLGGGDDRSVIAHREAEPPFSADELNREARLCEGTVACNGRSEAVADADGGGTATSTSLTTATSDDWEIPEVEAICRGRWGSDPLFRGSYSYVAVGASGEDIDILAEPLPRQPGGSRCCVADLGQATRPALQLLFAGEATHRFCYSTTHGAYLSGEREAERLMKHYGWLP